MTTTTAIGASMFLFCSRDDVIAVGCECRVGEATNSQRARHHDDDYSVFMLLVSWRSFVRMMESAKICTYIHTNTLNVIEIRPTPRISVYL